ncbi:MAG: hypothetical protein WC643_04295 [Parcubacteria group bacterium]
MSWGGASMYIDEETGVLLLPAEVSEEELAVWEKMLQKIKKMEDSSKTIH